MRVGYIVMDLNMMHKMFPLLYEVIENKYGGLGGTYDPEDFGQASGIKFNVPDYKARKLVGAGGGVSGGGSPVSGNVISTVGQTGGRWFSQKHNKKHYLILETS